MGTLDDKVQLDQIYALLRLALKQGVPEQAIVAEVESAIRAHNWKNREGRTDIGHGTAPAGSKGLCGGIWGK